MYILLLSPIYLGLIFIKCRYPKFTLYEQLMIRQVFYIYIYIYTACMLFIFKYFSYLNLSSHCWKVYDSYICHRKCNKIGVPDMHIQVIPLTFYFFMRRKHSAVDFTLAICSCVGHFLSHTPLTGSQVPDWLRQCWFALTPQVSTTLVPSSNL